MVPLVGFGESVREDVLRVRDLFALNDLSRFRLAAEIQVRERSLQIFRAVVGLVVVHNSANHGSRGGGSGGGCCRGHRWLLRSYKKEYYILNICFMFLFSPIHMIDSREKKKKIEKRQDV